ncbi:MAG: rhomboid family intramembrane serine protease [Sedimentisphaerales bacterium]|nr:rhomboid family intramembrane serine protease [Sedimentisphaerales bacterium]
MGLYDRDYTQESFHSQFRNAPQMRIGFPKPSLVVRYLLIINLAIFGISLIAKPLGAVIYGLFELNATSVPHALQLWRLITYQFLHASLTHILFNMLGLYFLGPTLERHWSSKRFLKFYLGCGAAGGIFYLLLVAVGFLPAGVMVGASGAILGMLAACAILFPHFVVFLLFFPIPIRVAAVAFTIFYLFAVIGRGVNAGGDAAHLAGMAAGAVYVFWPKWRGKLKSKADSNRWQQQMRNQQNLQVELDRILEKLHEKGISSLTRKEKKILKEATKAEQMRDKL